MTPLQLAKEECSRFSGTKGCGSVGTCRVDRERCVYFEECVLPMERFVSDDKRKHAIRDARFQYCRVVDESKRVRSLTQKRAAPVAAKEGT